MDIHYATGTETAVFEADAFGHLCRLKEETCRSIKCLLQTRACFPQFFPHFLCTISESSRLSPWPARVDPPPPSAHIYLCPRSSASRAFRFVVPMCARTCHGKDLGKAANLRPQGRGGRRERPATNQQQDTHQGLELQHLAAEQQREKLRGEPPGASFFRFVPLRPLLLPTTGGRMKPRRI